MTEMDELERNVDSRIKQMIKTLRPTPERDPKTVERGLQKFLAELDSNPEFESRSTYAWFAGWFKHTRRQKDNTSMIPRNQRFPFATTAVLLTILILLFGGVGATAVAAQLALPGDTLYAVKTNLENTRILLAGDAYDQAQLYLTRHGHKLRFSAAYFAGLKPPAQYLEALPAGTISRFQLTFMN